MVAPLIVEGTFTSPGGHSMTMAYRAGTADWNVLNASLNEDEYGLPDGISGHAVDVGGYLGSVGIALALDNPGLDVRIIEPVPENCDLIERNVQLNKVWNRVTLIRGAVGGPDDDEVTVVYGFQGSEAAEHHAYVGNSTLAYEGNVMLPHEAVRYYATKLADLVPLDFLKIDCEGGEWTFLHGPVPQVALIVGEWHNVDGHTLGDMAALLGPTHVVTFSGSQIGPGGFRAVRR